jgi:hypothetical protein
MAGRADRKLFEAISKGNVAATRAALDAGAELNRRWPGQHPLTVRDNWRWHGERPLTVAATHGHAPLVKLLIKRGANVDLMTETWHTPLMIASGAGKSAIVRLLLDAGADLNRMNRNQETALTYAVVWGQLRAVKLLLAYGADVEERQGGWSPLMYAANAEHPKIVEVLVEYGADRVRKDRYGRTARDIAAQNPCSKILRAFDRIETARGARSVGRGRHPGLSIASSAVGARHYPDLTDPRKAWRVDTCSFDPPGRHRRRTQSGGTPLDDCVAEPEWPYLPPGRRREVTARGGTTLHAEHRRVGASKPRSV